MSNSSTEQSASRDFDIRSLLQAALAYKWVILVSVCVVGGAVTLWTLELPKIYEAVCTIEYDPHPVRPLGEDVEDVADPLGGFWASREFFETQNRIIASRNVAERVVEELGLHHDAGFWGANPSTFEPTTVERAATVLMGMVTVAPVKDTRLVTIRVTNRDPERAKILANAVAHAYREKTIEDRLGSTLDALEWLGQQLDSLRDELNDAELALHSFKEDHNILSVSLEDRQNLVAGEIEAYSTALTTTRARRIELSARAQRLREANREDPLAVEAPMLDGNESIVGLRSALREKMAERASLQTRYGPAHPTMRALSEDIDELTEQLRSEIELVISSAEADLAEVQRVENGLGGALDESHSEGIALNLREIEYQRLNRERENKEKLYEIVLSRTTETNLTRMMRSTHVRIVDEALTPASPVSPNVPVNIMAGLLGGLVLGVCIAFGLRFLDRRLKTAREVEDLGLSVVGILPELQSEREADEPKDARGPPASGEQRDLFTHLSPMSTAAECTRTIRTNLMFMSADKPIRCFVVTSPTPRDGKTTVACNLAVAIANSGKRVLLVDTDLRRPRIHRTFGCSSARGVTSVIVGEASLAEAASPTDIPGLDVLPCGPIPPNPSELLHGAAFEELVETARGQYDQVIFDSPPLGAVTDAAVIAPRTDGVLIVVKADKTTRDGLRGALRQLGSVGAKVLGSVVNGVKHRAGGYGEGYYQYYRYRYYDSDDATGGPTSYPDRAAE